MPSFVGSSCANTFCTLLSIVQASFDPSSNRNVAIYWGQNSYGAGTGLLAQQRLAAYCVSSDLDIIPLAFNYAIRGVNGMPFVNFANADNNCTVFSGTQLLNCPQLSDDIETCQQAYNKSIVLSIGGATYAENGFASSEDAINAANTIWNTFGPQQMGNKILRPFESSAINGFDLDFESTINNMVPFANRLRDLMDEDTASSGNEWLLTAAPQCPYPDLAENEMLNGSVYFDAVWVQFYNNECGLQSFKNNASMETAFNFKLWDEWARAVSKNPGVKVLLGIPGSATAASSGYTSASDLVPIIDYCKGFPSFGGIMMWDASQAFQNEDFISRVVASLA